MRIFLTQRILCKKEKSNRQPGIITEELWDKLTSYISSWLACKDEDTVNGHRTQIFKKVVLKWVQRSLEFIH